MSTLSVMTMVLVLMLLNPGMTLMVHFGAGMTVNRVRLARAKSYCEY